MLFRQKTLEGVRQGTITLAFRRWIRPSVHEGGTLLTAVGQLQIGSVARVEPEGISAEDARRAGYTSREALLADLAARDEGDVYRVEIVGLRRDPRIALREARPDAAGLDALEERLRRLDARAPSPWTRATLELVAEKPGVRAGDLSRKLGAEKEAFKLNVRKLKGLGLTESLEVGYRLSPRGESLLARLRGGKT
jgi:hypothetical protein